MRMILFRVKQMIRDAVWRIRASLCSHQWKFTGTFSELNHNREMYFVDTYRCTSCQMYCRCPRSLTTVVKGAPPVYGFRNYTC